MRKNLIFSLLAIAALCALLPSCAKEQGPYDNEAIPSVSLSAPSSQFVMDQASVVLELSHFIHKDVNVTFLVEGIEAEAIDLPGLYTIEAGAIKKVIPVSIDEEKASIGNKNVSISIGEVENATLTAAKQVGIGINIEDVAMVNVSATEFDDNLTATLRFSLSKAVTKDVVLGLAYDPAPGGDRKPLPASSLEFPSSVTIPAGAKTGSVAVKASKTGLPEDAYQARFTIASYGSNATAGTVTDATLILNVGFQPTLLSTDEVRFIYTSGWLYVYYNNVHPYYFIWNEPIGDGDASDMDYVKAAMYRCRDWVKDASHAAAWLSYWSSFAGYEAYVPNGCPQLTANKTGYWGWPMIMINDGAIEDLDEVVYGNGSYHSFLVGFDENQDLMETYQYMSFSK